MLARMMLAVLAGASAQAASAEAHGAVVLAAMETCVAAAGSAECVGVGSAACEATAPDAVALMAGPCAAAERVFWEGRIALALAGLLAAELPPQGAEVDFAALDAAFLTYRQVACDAEAAVWPGMTGSGEVWATCQMQVTAAHAVRLEHWLEALE